MTTIGVPAEIKPDEYRIGLTPAVVEELTALDHRVLVESEGGEGSGLSNRDYLDAGAEITENTRDIWNQSDIIVKVKEPVEDEPDLVGDGQVVFTFFHFAASEELTRRMADSGGTCIAYETIERADGRLPVLTPMSEVAGRMAVQEGAKFLEKPQEGRGVLLGGVPGVREANTLILGGGTVGSNAARVAAGMGSSVTILDIDLDRLRYLDEIMPGNVSLQISNKMTIREHLQDADLVVGAVLATGARAPVLVKKEHLSSMKDGAVIVDVAVDQGGCVETARPTTHHDPVYTIDGVVHYCVSNMPGAVGRTSTFALSNATWPYLRELVSEGWEKASRSNPEIKRGLNIVDGHICHKAVAQSHDMRHTTVEELLK